MMIVIIIVQLNGICCQKPSAETVKQPVVNSENPSRCPTEGTILVTASPRESRLGTPRRPRAQGSPASPPGPGRGRLSSGPLYLRASGSGSPRARPRPRPGAESAAREAAGGAALGSGRRNGRAAGRVGYLGPQTP